jgi:acyl-CoA reductase-like NAD-dependent aldehyde dehydrogenase
MQTPSFKFTARGNFIDGNFIYPAEANGEWVGKSPANFSDQLGTHRYSYAAIDDAVTSARKAFATWRKTKLS